MLTSVRPVETKARTLSMFALTPEGEAAGEKIAKALKIETTQTLSGGLSAASRLIGTQHLGGVLVLELSREFSDIHAAMLKELKSNAVMLVCVGPAIDLSRFRALISTGVSDYLTLPVGDDDLASVHRHFHVIHQENSGTDLANVTAFIPTVGGVGATTAAVNFASILAKHGKRVALVDLDTEFGSAFVHLNLPATTGLLDAVLSPERVDRTFLDATMANPEEKLFVYSTEGASSVVSNQPDLYALIQAIKAVFDEVVIDLPRHVLTRVPGVLSATENVVLICCSELSSLRNRQSIEANIRQAAPQAQIFNVLSYRRKYSAITHSEIDLAVSLKFDVTLPFSEKALANSNVSGKALSSNEPEHAYSKALGELAVKASKVTVRRRNFLTRLFS